MKIMGMGSFVIHSEGEEKTYTLWSPSMVIDFGHITRLEKVVGERFKHLKHDSFSRAGICVTDIFLDVLFGINGENALQNIAPEIMPLIHYEKDVGGKVFVQFYETHLGGSQKLFDEIVSNHNTVVGLDEVGRRNYLETRHFMIHGPILWATCHSLASALLEAERKSTEAWEAMTKDRVSLAFALGWRSLLHELGEVNTRALFLFS
jgi:hypothetical protein